MPQLLPFPHYHRPPGRRPTQLPNCREGLACLPDDAFTRREGPAFVGMHIRNQTHDRWSRGLCGLLPAAAFMDGTVLPHEKTLAARLARQEQLVKEDGGALGKLILLFAPNLDAARATLRASSPEPERELRFEGDTNDYELYRYPLAETLDLTDAGQLIIADGHHRAETHARLAADGFAACDHIPVCILPAAELYIGSFLRCIQTEWTDAAPLLARLRPYFEIMPTVGPRSPEREGDWTLRFQNHFFYLRPIGQPATQTAVRWLDGTVLPGAFGIYDARQDERLTYSDEPDDGRGGFPARAEAGVVYLRGRAITRERFLAEVKGGQTLPPKSTRFEPRVPSGVLVWKPNA